MININLTVPEALYLVNQETLKTLAQNSVLAARLADLVYKGFVEPSDDEPKAWWGFLVSLKPTEKGMNEKSTLSRIECDLIEKLKGNQGVNLGNFCSTNDIRKTLREKQYFVRKSLHISLIPRIVKIPYRFPYLPTHKLHSMQRKLKELSLEIHTSLNKGTLYDFQMVMSFAFPKEGFLEKLLEYEHNGVSNVDYRNIGHAIKKTVDLAVY